MINLDNIETNNQDTGIGDLEMDTIRYYLPGIILLMIAIIIIAVPEVLIAFIASMVIMAAIGALYIGHKIRKSEIEFKNMDNRSSQEDSFRRRFTMKPIFRSWNRWF